MGEPSKEALKAAREHFNLLGIKDYAESAAWGLAHHFDRFTEQRVAAAVQEERERCARICEAEAALRKVRMDSNSPNWPDPMAQGHKAVTAHKLAEAIRADRPAPEGAAPTMPLSEACLRGGCQLGPTTGHNERDLARHRCSTPSQEISIANLRALLETAYGSACAELLAQIREPSEELFGLLKDKYWQFGSDELAEFMSDLADKLTEAK